MSTINFYLKRADKKGNASVMLTYQHKGEKFRYYTRLKVNPTSWKNQRVKNNYSGFSEINGILDDIENSLKSIEREALFNKKEYSVEVVKRKFLLQLGEVTHENDFF